MYPGQLSLAEDFFYNQEVSYDVLEERLNLLLEAGAREIRMQLLLSEEPLVNSAPQIHHLYRELFRSRNSVSGELEGSFGKKQITQIQGKFKTLQHPRFRLVWLLVSHSGSDFFRKPMRLFLRSVRPHPAKAILRTSQIQQLLETTQSFEGVRDLRVKQLGIKGRIASKGAKKTIESDRKWTDKTIKEAFDDAYSEDHWITSAAVSYRAASGSRARLTIGRYGQFVFWNSVTPDLKELLDVGARMAQERYEFLRNRDRTKKTDFRNRPFLITFQEPILETRTSIEQLHSALDKVPKVTCSVLHGNPYFHAVLVDYTDGSTYEVLVVNNDKITVIPQGRSTVRALQRLCAGIFSEFREGDLKELK